MAIKFLNTVAVDTNVLYVDAINNRVGIGTTSPTAKLDVKGDGAEIYLKSADYSVARIIPRGTGTNVDKGLFSLFDTGVENVRIDTEGSSWFNGGNVGIGTTSPTRKLNVNGNVGINNQLLLDSANYGEHLTIRRGIYGYDTIVTGTRIDYSPTASTNTFKFLADLQTTGQLNVTGNAIVNGNVGIGTTSPGYKLDVSGGLRATAESTFTNNLLFPDNSRIKIGSGNDLQIYHDGSNSYIENETGNLTIFNKQDDGDVSFASDNGSGGTTTYLQLDGSHTQSIAWKDIHFVDGIKAKFGDYASPDLEIYHDGSNSYITDTGTGNLLITSNSASVQINKGLTENMAEFIVDGAVNLYYDSAKKFETTSTGVSVTGTTTATTFLGDLNGTINTVTTAVTKANATNDTTVATTAFVQNLIGTIPAGLVFQGTWNAATNTPTLTSGSGTTGNFYIVSTSGSTNLDGVTDWVTGDWAVFIEQGGTDAWEKIDNSSVLDGAGTGQTLPLWSGSGTSNTLTDSRFTQTSTQNIITGPGNTAADYSLKVENAANTTSLYIQGTGEVVVAANYFYVAASQGAYINGILRARGGVTDDQGTLNLGGNGITTNLTLTSNTLATFAGNVTLSGQAAPQLFLDSNTGGTPNYTLIANASSQFIIGRAGVSNDFILDSGNATFAGDVTVSGGDITLGGTGRIQGIDTVSANTDAANKAYVDAHDGGAGVYLPLVAGSSNPLTGTLYGTSTNFSGSGDYAGSMTLGTGASTAEVHLTIGQGRTDSGFSYIDLVGGTTYPDYGLRIIRGNTGANAGGGIYHRGTGNLDIQATDSASILLRTNNTTALTLTNTQNAIFTGNVGIGTTSPDQLLTLQGNSAAVKVSESGGAELRMAAGGSLGYIGTYNNNDLAILVNGAEKIRVKTNGNVGIGTTNPSQAKLVVSGNVAFNQGDETMGQINPEFERLEFKVSDGVVDATPVAMTLREYVGGARLGIGTTSPSQKLHVDGSTLISAEKYYYTAGTGAGFGSDASGNFKIRQNDADLIFGSGNNVGIGTTNPGAKLHIEGTGTSGVPQVIIASGGADNDAILEFADDERGQVCQIGSIEGNELTLAAMGPLVFKTNDGTVAGGNPSMKIEENGALELNNYTSTSYKSGVTPINPIQSFYPSNGVGSDTTTDLAVDQQGNVVRTTQEATWKLTRAQVDALTTSTAGTTLLSAPGSSNLFIIIEKVTFLIQFAYNGNQMSTTQQYQIVQDGNVADEIAVINGSRINDIAYSGYNINTSGIYEHDTGYSTLNRTYKPNTSTNIRRVNTGALNTAVSTMSIKIRYRVYDKTTF
jgi:hypothetical protein